MDARVGFTIGSTVYKLCTVTVGSKDDSVYIFSSFGSVHKDKGLVPPKITYHEKGDTWTTAELQVKHLSEEFIEKSKDTKIQGVPRYENKFYMKGEEYEPQPSLDEIESENLVVRLKHSMEHYDIHNTTDYSHYAAVENSKMKGAMTDTVKGEGYKGIRIDFLLVSAKRYQEFEKFLHENNKKAFSYKHPRRDIFISVCIRESKKPSAVKMAIKKLKKALKKFDPLIC